MYGMVKVELIFMIGADEAVMLDYFESQMSNPSILNGHDLHGKIIDGVVWAKAPVSLLRTYFKSWSDQKIRKVLKSLESQGMLKSGRFNEHGVDKTKWYTVSKEV